MPKIAVNPAQTAASLIAKICAVSVLLTACAGPTLIQSDVQSFTQGTPSTPLAAGASYKFERLPSQNAAPEQQSSLEATSRVELEKLGLKYDEKTPQFTVQVSARTIRQDSDAFQTNIGFGWGPGFGLAGRDYALTRNGTIVWLRPAFGSEAPTYTRELQVVVRDAKTQAVVYETQARHEGRWANGAQLLPAIVQAALAGFPTPPAGPRKVSTPVAPAAN